MALRVTQGMMYSSFTGSMNSTLNDLMESSIQGASQKRINRPSDNAVGAGRIISYRANLARMEGYEDNIKTAMGWLGTADGVLCQSGSVVTVLNKLKTLAQQGANGTYDADNREQMGFEIRELFMQLINLSNSTYNGRHIFAGHKTDQSAFIAGLGVTANDPNLSDVQFKVEGGASKTVIIQANETGTADSVTYRYSADGGTTWQDATVDTGLTSPQPGSIRINAGGVSVVMPGSTTMTGVEHDNPNENDNGSWLYVRPTAIYQGDDHDIDVVTPYGSSISASADGFFQRDVAVRIDNVEGGKITYSYSIDDGSNWIQGTAPDDGANTRVPILGGFLNINGTPTPGEQYIVHPRRADVDFLIAENDSITVNMVGKDVFGGVYQDPGSGLDYPTPVGGVNLFETIGKLVAYAETNSQQGMQECLDEINDVMNRILTQAAVVGGRENRLAVTYEALELRKYETEDSIGQIEDVDVAELMAREARQKLAYNSVLKSSSMIMQMSLLNYL